MQIQKIAWLEPQLLDDTRFMAGEMVPQKGYEEEERDQEEREEVYALEKCNVPTGDVWTTSKATSRGQRVEMLAIFHHEIVNWDAGPTGNYIRNRFWWPREYQAITEYVAAYYGCQHTHRLPMYHTNFRAPVTGLFDTFSIDFVDYSRGRRPGTSSC